MEYAENITLHKQGLSQDFAESLGQKRGVILAALDATLPAHADQLRPEFEDLKHSSMQPSCPDLLNTQT